MIKEIIGDACGLGYRILENARDKLTLDVGKFVKGKPSGLMHRIEFTRKLHKLVPLRKDSYRNVDEDNPDGYGPILYYEEDKLVRIALRYRGEELSSVEEYKQQVIKSTGKLTNIVDLSNHEVLPRIEESDIYTEGVYERENAYDGIIVSEQNDGKNRCVAILKNGYFWGFVGFEVEGKLYGRAYYEDDLYHDEFEQLKDRAFRPYGDYPVFHR